jgi:hypothetical protein
VLDVPVVAFIKGRTPYDDIRPISGETEVRVG